MKLFEVFYQDGIEYWKYVIVAETKKEALDIALKESYTLQQNQELITVTELDLTKKGIVSDAGYLG